MATIPHHLMLLVLACSGASHGDEYKRKDVRLISRVTHGKPEYTHITGSVTCRTVAAAPEKKKVGLLSCPGHGNELTAGGSRLPNPIEAGCTSVSLEGCHCRTVHGIFQIDRFQCKIPPTGWTFLENQACGPAGRGIVVQLAFKVERRIVPLIECCLDIRNSSTFYTTHTIRGRYLSNGPVRKQRYVSGDGRLFDPTHLYKMKNLRKVLPTSVSYNEYPIKGMLAPPADFVRPSHQRMSFFYANTVPLWKSTSRRLKFAEKEIRKIAKQQRADLNVITGTSGILIIKERYIMLGQDRLPVPKVLWKVIRRKDSCMGFIFSNDPFHSSRPLCEDTCRRTGWLTIQGNASTDQVYCCSYITMKIVIPELPDVSCVSDLTIQKALQ